MNNIEEIKNRIGQQKKVLDQQKQEAEAIERRWRPMSFKENIQSISDLACLENKPIKAETNYIGRYVIIPAQSNIIDTELSLVEQRDGIKSFSDEKILKDWQDICKDQEASVIGDGMEIYGIALSKEMFQRSSEMRKQLDLPQTFRLYQVLNQSNNPENKELLPEVEKDLQTKAWRFFANEFSISDMDVLATPYSVSCIEGLKDYMSKKMNAPKDVTEPKLENIEKAMMGDIQVTTLQKRLTPQAAKLVLDTALKYPLHASSERILQHINRTVLNRQGGKEGY